MRDKRIEYIETNPDIFVELMPGWQYDGAHCFGEDSMKDVRETMKSVKRCDCEQCKSYKVWP